MNLTLKQMKVFMAIVKHGNMTEAAKSIHMTKGALSQNIAELEAQLGTTVFDRRNSRLQINNAGIKLIPLADEVLSRMQTIENEFSQHSKLHNLKIGCTKSIGSFFLPNLLKNFEAQYGWLPEVLIENSHTIQSALSRFELDIGLLENSAIDQTLQHEFWMKDEMVIIASRDHPLAKLRSINYEDLNQQRWILREPLSASRQYFDQQLATHFNHPFDSITLNSFDAILLCVLKELGITMISKKCIQHSFYQEHLVQLNMQDQYLRNFNIVHHKNKYLSPDLLNVIQFIKTQ